MQPTQEKKIETSAGMETATETVNRIKNTLNMGVVDVNALEQSGDTMEVPQVEVGDEGVSQAVAAGNQAVADQTARLAEADKAASEQESTVRELFETVSGRGAERVSREQEAGIPESQKELADLTSNIRLATEKLSIFDDNTFLGEEQLREDASSRDLTKRTFGAKANQRRLQRAIERTGLAAQLRVSIASAELLQNNITAAKSQIADALELEYGPLEQQLELETQFLNREWQVADREEQRTYEARMRVVEQQQRDIADAKDMILNATPYATPAELKAMNDPNLSPTERYKKAHEVVARGLREDRSYEISQRNLDLALTRQEYQNALNTANPAAAFESTVLNMNDMRDHDSIRGFLSTVAGLDSVSGSLKSNLKASTEVMVTLGEWAGQNPEGEFVGLGAGGGIKNFLWLGSAYNKVFGSEADKAESAANRGRVEAVNLKVQQWASGAALTEEQTKQVAKMTPKIGDTDMQIRRKSNQLYNFMNDVNESNLLLEGINVKIPEVDLWEAQSLLEKASAEDIREINDAALIHNSSTPAFN